MTYTEGRALPDLFREGTTEMLTALFGKLTGVKLEVHRNNQVRYRLASTPGVPGVWISREDAFMRGLGELMRYEALHNIAAYGNPHCSKEITDKFMQLCYDGDGEPRDARDRLS